MLTVENGYQSKQKSHKCQMVASTSWPTDFLIFTALIHPEYASLFYFSIPVQLPACLNLQSLPYHAPHFIPKNTVQITEYID